MARAIVGGIEATDDTLPVLITDGLLDGANGGVLFLADMESRFSWPAQSNFSDAEPVYDLAGGSAGSFQQTSATLPTFSGNGWDYGSGVDLFHHLEVPARVAASIYGAGGSGEHDYVIALYAKLIPTESWYGTGVHGMLHQGASYTATPVWGTFGPEATLGRLVWRRAKSVSASINSVYLDNVHTNFADKVIQIGLWKSGGIMKFLVQSADLRALSSGSAAPAIEHDYSSLPFLVGNLNVAYSGKFFRRLYRFWAEDLTVSGRSPEDVLDADWNRTIARGVFS